MARTDLFRFLARCARLAAHCERTGMPEAEAVEAARDAASGRGRRRLLQGAAGAATLAVFGANAGKSQAQGAPDVAVVGAGFAGLYAATVLAGKAITAQVYEAGNRSGGRVASLRG